MPAHIPNLEKRHYNGIASRMLDINPAVSSALRDMTGQKLALPKYESHSDPTSRLDFSFTTQIGELLLGDKPPRLIFFTVKSAVPVADAVKGFCETADIRTPRLLPINVNRRLWYEYNRPASLASVIANYKIDKAVDFLRPLVDNQKVAIVEEAVATGQCLELAGLITQRAGASSIMGVRGFWYDNAHQIDLSNMTSPHADFMYQVGSKAAKLSIKNYAQNIT